MVIYEFSQQKPWISSLHKKHSATNLQFIPKEADLKTKAKDWWHRAPGSTTFPSTRTFLNNNAEIGQTPWAGVFSFRTAMDPKKIRGLVFPFLVLNHRFPPIQHWQFSWLCYQIRCRSVNRKKGYAPAAVWRTALLPVRCCWRVESLQLSGCSDSNLLVVNEGGEGGEVVRGGVAARDCRLHPSHPPRLP